MKKRLILLILVLAVLCGISFAGVPTLPTIPWVINGGNTNDYSRTNLPTWWNGGTNFLGIVPGQDYSLGVPTWMAWQLANYNFMLVGQYLSTNSVAFTGDATGSGAGSISVTVVNVRGVLTNDTTGAAAVATNTPAGLPVASVSDVTQATNNLMTSILAEGIGGGGGGPVVVSVYPATLAASGDATLKVAGQGFAAGFSLTIGGASLASTLVSATRIDVAWTGYTLPDGVYDVVYTGADSNSFTLFGGFTIGPGPGALADAQTNAVLNSFRVASWTTNGISLAAGATNAAIWVTNLAGVDYTAILGTPVLRYSFNGSNWVNGSSTLVTNVPVRVMFYSGEAAASGSISPTPVPMPGAVTNVTYWRLTRPDLFGKTNALYGERLLLSEPKIASEAATKNYVDQVFSGTPWWSAGSDVQLNQYPLHFNIGWSEFVGGNQGTVLHLDFLGKDAYTVSYTAAATVTNTLTATLDETGTNVVVSMLTNGISAAVRLMFSHVMVPLNWQLSDSVPALVGNQWVFTVPFPWTDSGFCAATIPSANPGVLTLQTVLQLTPRTITNASSTTWGYPAGLVCCDSNYVYVAVGTNLWKRVGLSTW